MREDGTFQGLDGPASKEEAQQQSSAQNDGGCIGLKIIPAIRADAPRRASLKAIGAAYTDTTTTLQHHLRLLARGELPQALLPPLCTEVKRLLGSGTAASAH